MSTFSNASSSVSLTRSWRDLLRHLARVVQPILLAHPLQEREKPGVVRTTKRLALIGDGRFHVHGLNEACATDVRLDHARLHEPRELADVAAGSHDRALHGLSHDDLRVDRIDASGHDLPEDVDPLVGTRAQALVLVEIPPGLREELGQRGEVHLDSVKVLHRRLRLEIDESDDTAVVP
jgi:hypothetical protein